MNETDESRPSPVSREVDQWPHRHLETLSDIPGEIADRRIEHTYGDLIGPEKKALLHGLPNQQETGTDFRYGYEKGAQSPPPEGVVGYSTQLSEAGHILRQATPDTIATEIHESLHRLEDPRTVLELSRSLNEGLTELLTQRAAMDLTGAKTDSFYPEETAQARKFVEESSEHAVKDFYFNHQATGDLRKAL